MFAGCKFEKPLISCQTEMRNGSEGGIEEEKIYVALDSIIFAKEGMFIPIENEWFATNQLNLDDSGYFISSSAFCKISSAKASFYWDCPKCDYSNKFWSKKCENCGYDPRRSSPSE